MSTQLPPCPKCKSPYVYLDSALLICPECAYKWQEENQQEEATKIIKDANGNPLNDGDSVTVIKDLK
jgi:protein PhnA